MVAGSFKPRSPKRFLPTWGQNRDASAQGAMVSQGWDSAISMWVDCRAFIWSYDGNVYDITDDIITGSLVRNTDTPTTMTITFANEGDKYRQMFIPNDRIVLWLRRNEKEWQAFTGYIHNTPIFNLYSSRELTLECSCIIRRLNQKFWDPNLIENIYVLSGPQPQPRGDNQPPEEEPVDPKTETPDNQDPPNAIENAPEDDPETPEEPEDPLSESGPGGGLNTPDITLAFLLTAPDHVGLKPEMVLIQKFPQEWAERAAKITEQNQACMTLWRDIIKCPDDTPENCGEDPEGGYSGGPITKFPGEDASQGEIACWMATNARSRGLPGELPVTVSLHEHRGTMRNVPQNGCTKQGDSFVGFEGCAGGYFQQTPPFWGTADQVMNPEYALNAFLNAAMEFKGQFGTDCQGIADWGQAVQKAGVVGDMVGFCEQAKELLTGCKENAVVSNLDVEQIENAGEWLPHVQQVVDIVQGKFGTSGSTYANHGSQPGGASTAVDFVMPSGYGVAASGSSLDVGNKLAGFLDTNWEAFNIVYLIWQDQAKWSVGGGWEPYDESAYGGGSGNINSQRHLDHVHVSFDDTGTVGEYVDDGKKFNPSGTPCGSGSNGEAHADPEEQVLENSIQRSSRRVISKKLITMISDAKSLLGTRFTWGGGHGRNLIYRKTEWGVDSSGLFNVLRKMQGLQPEEVGSVFDYFRFLEDLRPFNPNVDYPVGTILVNPGNIDTIGHMGMIIDQAGHVLEANATGRVMIDFKVPTSNMGWEGYTHVGHMPDIGIDETPRYYTHAEVQAQKERHEQWLKEYNELKFQAEDEDSPIVRCSTHPETSGLVRVKTINDWDTVGDDKKLYYKLDTKYKSEYQRAFDLWGNIGGVEFIPSDGKRVDLHVYDGDRPDSVLATTSSEGWLENDIARMDAATPNTRQAVSVHEVGHAARLGHAPSDKPAVMQPSFISNSNNNSDTPTEYDVSEFKSVWGGSGTPGEGTTPDGGGQSNAEQEPCITRHPLGVYKLATTALAEAGSESTLMAEVKRFLSLNNGGLEEAKEHVAKHFPENELERFPEIWEPCTEEREWRHLAELDKESYMRTIQDVADSGLYTMMSIGTGEIVFWYPWFLGDLSKGVALTEEDKKKRGELLTPEEITDLQRKFPELRAYDLSGMSMEEAKAAFPEQLGPPAQQEIENPEDISGLPLDNTNAHVLSNKIALEDIDLVDFSLYVSDDPLVTHYFVLGEYRVEGGTGGNFMDLQCYRWSTIFDHPVIVNNAMQTANFDSFAFIQRYGVRSKSETVSAIKVPGMAQIWAEQQFLKQWLNCYLIQLQTTYLPEIYPGNRLEIKSLGIEVVVLQANHTFGSQWTTNLTVSMPLRITDKSKIPPLPFWTLFTTEMVNEGLDPTRPVGVDETNLNKNDPFGAPLEISGDLWESIQAKRDADNARVREYLDSWISLKEAGQLGLIEDWLEKNPAPQQGNPPSTTVPGENGPITLPTGPGRPPPGMATPPDGRR